MIEIFNERSIALIIVYHSETWGINFKKDNDIEIHLIR